MATMLVDKHLGYDITLDTSNGRFTALVENQEVYEDSLLKLRERLYAIDKKIERRRYVKHEPAAVICLIRERHGQSYRLWRGEITGILAGRTYSRGVTGMQKGQKVRLEEGRLYCLRNDDSRLPLIERMIAELAATAKTLETQKQALHTLQLSLPCIDVPASHSKEEALDKEPDFLQQLRSITPQQG